MLKNNKHPNKHLQNAWNKCGEDNFEFMILFYKEDCLLNKEEMKIINNAESYNPIYGYNKTLGGDDGNKEIHSQETREKISKKLKGKSKTKEHIEKLSISHKGKTTWNKGGILSEECKIKISHSRKGKCKGENHHQYGKKLSEEHKNKLNSYSKGHIPQNKITFSDEDKNTIFYLHDIGVSIRKIAKQFNVSPTPIKRIIIDGVN